ncbi:PucR family transcriptional regulator [Leucobacter chromiiresistens]|uniref:Fis family transcriptional regulator n=1 Tax=Leucobacter chromiiresistens TaxID=1079994 RepID=A0A147EL81_9MICO|nr:PucR family transcriptional regulator [Leucobacter chromiiresistens]KTR85076.1 Fis family transcriptional regulator [Leucobacter chromiiresistens]
MVAFSQLLAVPHLRLRLVQSGAGDPAITWVSNTELLDLGSYLEGGEIVLTTGLALAPDDRRWRDFVAGLNRARVAAIGFGVGVNHERIPQPLVQAASAYRVALFEVPLPTPFIAVSKAVAELLRADELGAARGALRAHQRLLEGARGDQQPAEVLASLAQATGKHLALLGSDGGALAATAGFAAAARSAGTADTAGTAEAEVIDLDAGGRFRLAVAGDSPLSPEGRSIVAAGAMVLGLALGENHAENARERERWERLTAALLAHRADAHGIGILAPGLAAPERVRVLALQGTAEDVAAWRRKPRSGLDRLVAPNESPAPAAGLERAWQIVADTPGSLDAALAAAAAANLDAVVGRPSSLGDAPHSRRSAASRLRALSPTAPLYTAPRVPAVVWADRDTPILEALLELEGAAPERLGARAADAPGSPGGPGDGARMSRRVLGPLSEHSDARGGPVESAEDRAMLRETLRALFIANGQRGPAAAALGIHRNTLRDRVARIERATSRSVNDPDDRAELWLALRIEDAETPGDADRAGRQ